MLKVIIATLSVTLILVFIGCSSTRTVPTNGLTFNLTTSAYQEGNTPGINHPTREVHYIFSGITNANRVDIEVVDPYGHILKHLNIDSEGNFQGDIIIGRITQGERERFTRLGSTDYVQYAGLHKLSVLFKIYRNGSLETATLEQGKLVYQ